MGDHRRSLGARNRQGSARRGEMAASSSTRHRLDRPRHRRVTSYPAAEQEDYLHDEYEQLPLDKRHAAVARIR